MEFVVVVVVETVELVVGGPQMQPVLVLFVAVVVVGTEEDVENGIEWN